MLVADRLLMLNKAESGNVEQEDTRTEASLVLLSNLVNHQNDLLGGREISVIDLLLQLRQSTDRNVRPAFTSVDT